ncbi:hypothetical protein [Propionispora sp. 2/2-37]|uniref:hypothetical protein n=1 Tax=Propionispora sp. 2/2-37 TaxID=1677858 RepID=UPI0006BB7CB4|nr:hypothetical protein [Propionispora sp. 2/2-37]
MSQVAEKDMLEPIPQSTRFTLIVTIILAESAVIAGMSMTRKNMTNAQCAMHLRVWQKWLWMMTIQAAIRMDLASGAADVDFSRVFSFSLLSSFFSVDVVVGGINI